MLHRYRSSLFFDAPASVRAYATCREREHTQMLALPSLDTLFAATVLSDNRHGPARDLCHEQAGQGIGCFVVHFHRIVPIALGQRFVKISLVAQISQFEHKTPIWTRPIFFFSTLHAVVLAPLATNGSKKDDTAEDRAYATWLSCGKSVARAGTRML